MLLSRRNIVILAAGGVLLSTILALGVAWYFGDQMIVPVHRPARATYREKVEDVRDAEGGKVIVSLKRTPASAKQGTYGLYWDGGSALLGPIMKQTSARVDREVLTGARPPRSVSAGISWSYGPDPQAAFGLAFSEVIVNTDLGPAPAWYIPVDPQQQTLMPPHSWIITIHGSNADRRQFLRFVPELHKCGLSILDVTYRNDVGAPPSPDKLMHLGLTEWRDLDAAVRTATSMGAQHILLFGGSMGGAIALQYLAQSAEASRIAAVLLEAPMLSVPAMIEHIAKDHRIPLPGATTSLAIRVTNARLADDIRQIDVLRFPPKVHPPMLLLQGTDDEVMPCHLAREFARREQQNGWPIQYAEFPGADHGSIWNSDRHRAEALIETFLTAHRTLSESQN